MFIRKLFVPLQTILCTCRDKWHCARIKDREVRRCTEGLTHRLTRDYAMVGWTDGRDAESLLPKNNKSKRVLLARAKRSCINVSTFVNSETILLPLTSHHSPLESELVKHAKLK